MPSRHRPNQGQYLRGTGTRRSQDPSTDNRSDFLFKPDPLGHIESVPACVVPKFDSRLKVPPFMCQYKQPSLGSSRS